MSSIIAHHGKKENEMEENFKTNPMALMMAMAVESSLESTSKIIELVSKYKASGVDVVPISEIDECLKSGTKKVMSEDSLTASMLKKD